MGRTFLKVNPISYLARGRSVGQGRSGQAYTEYLIILAVWFVALGYVVAGSRDFSKHLFSGFVEVRGTGNTNLLSLIFDFYASIANYLNLAFF